MKSSAFLQGLAAVCLAATASAAFGQTNSVQLFDPVNVKASTTGSGSGANAKTFNSTNLSLTCPSSIPIQAKLSSSPDGSGNVLVDNYISLSVSGGTTLDICRDGTTENGNQQNCFNGSYESQAKDGGLNGQNPDRFVASGGVPALDISSHFTAGKIQAKIGFVDTGGFVTSATLYLVTNCTPNGVIGPGLITGNPISKTNPTDQQLSQGYSFNFYHTQLVHFGYDLSAAQNSGKLTITDGVVPITADIALDPTNFQTTFLHDTSFATANCLVHTGELYNELPACKLYTLTCQVGTDPSQSGVLCPASLERNEIFRDMFDGPSFTLPDIKGTDGLTFHQGVGLLEAKEGWKGGSCKFDSTSGIANQLCPQNLLTSFSGPGVYDSGGSGDDANSAFITVLPVPEDLTAVNVTGQRPGYWINKHSATVNFVSTPPAVTSTNNFVAAPIQSITYGISPVSSVPPPDPPVPGDITVHNTACPAPDQANPPEATPFILSGQGVSVPEDGQYLLHYFAQDCAGTEELKFTQTDGNWATSFYTFPINVDTVAPSVSGPTLYPAAPGGGYQIGQKVTATYRCTDDRSGLAKCGASTYAPGKTPLDTGNIMSKVDTSQAGEQTYTVTAVDAAGNQTSASVKYLVAVPAVNLFIVKQAPRAVLRNDLFTYHIFVNNFSWQTASAVVVTDPLPAGVTFLQVRAQQSICKNGQCSSSCTFVNDTVSCQTPSLTQTTPFAVDIDVRVNAGAGTILKNTATVSSANPEGYPNNTQSTAFTFVY